MIHAILIRLIPRSLWDIHHAGHDAQGDATGQYQRSAPVEDFNFIAIRYPTLCGVDRVDKDPLWEGLSQPVVIIVRGVDPLQGVVSDGLQWNCVIARGFHARSNLPGIRNARQTEYAV